MLCEADIKVSWRARPRGFVALMGLYESNYLRFVQLAGEPEHLMGVRVSHVAGDCELRLAVLEHMPYTTMLSLTYVLPSNVAGGVERLPDLRLRAYRDARLLEAEELHSAAAKRSNHNSRATRHGDRELHLRWTRNMMLNKWLEYCAERGHRFTV